MVEVVVWEVVAMVLAAAWEVKDLEAMVLGVEEVV